MVNSNSINSLSPNTSEKANRLFAPCPQMATVAHSGQKQDNVWWRDKHKAIKDCPVHEFKTTISEGILSSTKRKLSQLPFTLLISKPCGRKVTCYPRFQNPSLGWKQEKKPQVLWPGVHRCGWRQGSGPMRKVHVCLGSTDRAAYLRGSLSMSGSCAHCPSGCHPFEERETLMGTKGSSKGKFLLQAGPKVPAIKEIIVVLHLAYLCPLSSRDKSESLWMDLNFQKEKYPEI